MQSSKSLLLLGLAVALVSCADASSGPRVDTAAPAVGGPPDHLVLVVTGTARAMAAETVKYAGTEHDFALLPGDTLYIHQQMLDVNGRPADSTGHHTSWGSFAVAGGVTFDSASGRLVVTGRGGAGFEGMVDKGWLYSPIYYMSSLPPYTFALGRLDTAYDIRADDDPALEKGPHHYYVAHLEARDTAGPVTTVSVNDGRAYRPITIDGLLQFCEVGRVPECYPLQQFSGGIAEHTTIDTSGHFSFTASFHNICTGRNGGTPDCSEVRFTATAMNLDTIRGTISDGMINLGDFDRGPTGTFTAIGRR
ncbi:MAG TPA: hypothetical protein VN706_08235 [Gemmatimonadaceae bacterium]|nr:hypothetical protein [Gemmatimonadaceae bacterium]